MQKSNRKIVIIGSIVAVLMFLFCFAIVPFYGLICKATGINTSISAELLTPSESREMSKKMDLSRLVTVQFIATNHMGMPWPFYPETRLVNMHPGEKKKLYFYIKNTLNKTMTVQAIPSMTPVEAMRHFHKIECFCFKQQTLKAGESRDMALVFQVDKDLPKDMHVITLSYTLFDVTPMK